MIFIKQYLIKLTFITFSVWVMPAATKPNLKKLNGKCQGLLETSLKLHDCREEIKLEIASKVDVSKKNENSFRELINEMIAKIKAIDKEVKEPWMNNLFVVKLLSKIDKIDKHANIDSVVNLSLLYVVSLAKEHLEQYIIEGESDDMTKKIKPFCDARITKELYRTTLTKILDIEKLMEDSL